MKHERRSYDLLLEQLANDNTRLQKCVHDIKEEMKGLRALRNKLVGFVAAFTDASQFISYLV